MSTHKAVDRICIWILAITVAVCLLAMNAKALGVVASNNTGGYESRLFDTDSVHTIDIITDEWDSFIENCTDEEYIKVNVLIDNELYKNVGFRAKGNTSLTNVASYGNDRYSFKIEFDHYDSNKTYYGLDKLCLNNIIQDNTYMKDYISYTLMQNMGVDAPLCSYVQLSINGEVFGLYLAVEGIEDAFLRRNYGNEAGDLYKPDSTSMGGERGNGKNFNMEDMNNSQAPENQDFNRQDNEDSNHPSMPAFDNMPENKDSATANTQGGPPTDRKEMQGAPSDQQSGTQSDTTTGATAQSENEDLPSLPDAEDSKSGATANTQGGPPTDRSEMQGAPSDQQSGTQSDTTTGATAQSENEDLPSLPDTEDSKSGATANTQGGPPTNRGEMQGKGNAGMGSDDVKLIYSDDDPDSYPNIFDNAKTKVTDKDSERLLSSLKALNEQTDLESVLNTDEVIRYFAVHNFVCNFDSYTGSMIHNYYLYEENGQLSMIPWDYNLAFGTFMNSSDASGIINFPIDSPVSGGSMDDRPMVSWIFSDSAYTEEYHARLQELVDILSSDAFLEEYDRVVNMISPYVESDPTSFCTYEEFKTGTDTLKEFLTLRCESVQKQLDGTLGSTNETQNSEDLVETGTLNLSDLGGMGNTHGGMQGGNKGEPSEGKPAMNDSPMSSNVQASTSANKNTLLLLAGCVSALVISCLLIKRVKK